MGGFSLVELMLSLSLGLVISGAMLQGLMAQSQNGTRFSRILRERAAQRRTLELVKHDLTQALEVSETPEIEQHGCPMAGRIPALHLRTSAGPITYSVGLPPSPIWRGRVLMRCGPPMDLYGRLSPEGGLQNRVVLDGLALSDDSEPCCSSLLLGQLDRTPFSACLDRESGILKVRLVLDIDIGSKSQKLVRESLMVAPSQSSEA